IEDYTRKLARSLHVIGLINIQFIVSNDEVYVIEVNPRSSRTVPYISKVTGVPMVEVASRVMLGEQLSDMPYGTGLYPVPPYVAVKVPVFSFEKLIDANAYLGPEMKSTGEVLGIGRTVEEALFKGLTSAGMMVHREEKGVLLSVDSHDLWELPPLAKKLADLGFCVYATPETADAVETLGITAVRLESITDDAVFSLLQSGKISYVVYTGALVDDTLADDITLHRRSVQLSVPCFTSLDTANALANSIAGRFTERNTEPVNICDMRPAKAVMPFTKMEATGDDYIFLDHFGGGISCPESLCVPLCNRHTGIGGYGICVMEKSRIADVRMRVFNSDGSNGGMAGNAIRCVGKYLFDKGLTRKRTVTVECEGKVKTLRLTTAFGKVTDVTVDMGTPSFAPRDIPVLTETPENFSLTAGGKAYDCFAVSMGNPHCVVFTDNPDALDLEKTGPLFENHPLFPERTNTEFVRVAGKNILRMRVYERGNGETGACGTGACAAVIAAVKKGYCVIGEPVTVKVRGGDLTVVYDGKNVTLTGDAKQVFEGTFTY
ncbi:MAG: diaminopimelate epimerase, partial [Clostridia bacterium]|nr:diaminopimelate epimerase [Clostridia bacterium]